MKSRAIPVLLLWAIVACCRANSTFTLTFTREVPAPSENPHASHQIRFILLVGGRGVGVGRDHNTSKTQTGSENRYEKRIVMRVETVS